MTYFIDLDYTLYNTDALVDDMIKTIAESVSKDENLNQTISDITAKFKTDVTDVFEFCRECANKYHTNQNEVLKAVQDVIADGKKYVYYDSVEFLSKLRKSKHKIVMLTFSSNIANNYQNQKVEGSGLSEYFDEIIITDKPKWKLDIDYSNGIFVDDDPKNITGFHSRKPCKIFWVKRPNAKFSNHLLPEDVTVSEISSLQNITFD